MPVSCHLPWLRRVVWRVQGIPADRLFQEMQAVQWWPRDRIEAYRNAKLQALIKHAYANVPYYREVMDERALSPQAIATAEDLSKLPVLTKELVRRRRESLWARNIPAGATTEVRTGGTTGAPMRIRRRRLDGALGDLYFARGLAWGGLLPHMPRIKLHSLALHPEPTGLVGALRGGRIVPPRHYSLSVGDLRRDTVPRYVEAIRRWSARHLLGYSSAVYLLAKFAEERGLTCRLDAVFPTAEPLWPAWRRTIAEVFSCRVFAYYGCGEVNALGFECGEGPGYHAFDDHAVIEVRRADGATALTGEGTLLVTDLDNYAMPLLRYENGDQGALSSDPCPCGRGLGRILRMDGRVLDMLVTCDGSKIPGGFADHIFGDIRNVDSFQVVQREPGQLTIRIVANNGFAKGPAERRLRDYYRHYLGEGARIEFEYAREIGRTAAEKLRVVWNQYLAREMGPDGGQRSEG